MISYYTEPQEKLRFGKFKGLSIEETIDFNPAYIYRALITNPMISIAIDLQEYILSKTPVCVISNDRSKERKRQINSEIRFILGKKKP